MAKKRKKTKTIKDLQEQVAWIEEAADAKAKMIRLKKGVSLTEQLRDAINVRVTTRKVNIQDKNR